MVSVRFWSSNNHLVRANAHTDSCATRPVPLDVLAQCRRCRSSCKPRPLCQSADLWSELAQPGLHHAFGWAWLKHCTSASALCKGGKRNLPTNVEERTEMPFTVLVTIRSHKGIKLHLGHCGFSEGHKREETKFVILRHSVYGKLSQQPQKTYIRE